jgi:hypothetical protein
MCSIRLQKGEARWNMSNFCKGDKVRLNDKGLRVMPSPTFRTDAVAMLGILKEMMEIIIDSTGHIELSGWYDCPSSYFCYLHGLSTDWKVQRRE